jgi:hypothetical protein
MKNSLQRLIPETGWKKFNLAERQLLLQNLDKFGVYGPASADYIRAHATQVGYFPQKSSGGGWTLLGNLTLPPESDLNDQRILAVITHEVFHLQQSIAMRLSIQGELLAWQFEYQAYHDATGKYYGERGLPFDGTSAQWDELSRLSVDSRQDLARAQRLMKEVSSVYRAEKLPLYPLGHEVKHALEKGFRRAV